MRMRRKPTQRAVAAPRIWIFAFCLLAPIFLCGLTVAAAAEPPAGEKPAGAMVEVHLREYVIGMPKSLVAGPTTFEIHNDGQKTHSFKIEGPGLDELLSAPIQPGTTGTLQVTLQPGEYKVYCPIGSHSAKGMTMTLVVTAKPKS